MFYVNELNTFLRDNALYLALGMELIIVIIIAILLISNYKKKHASDVLNELFISLLEALGGEHNVVRMEAKGSRLTIVLQDYQLLNQEALKALGIANFVLMTNKITLIIGQEAAVIAKSWSVKSR